MRITRKLSDNYTTLNNEIVRNKDLSIKAKGMYWFLMSLPEDWDFTIQGLKTQLKEGRDFIRTAIIELEEARLLIRVRSRKKGKLSDAEYYIYDEPQPMSENPTLANPTLENLPQQNIDKNKNIDLQNIYKRLKSNKHLFLTMDEYEKLKIRYPEEKINEIIDAIDNFKKNRKYNSLYLTCLQWLKKEKKGSEQKREKSKSAIENMNELLKLNN